jgi:hypothetical protein
MGSRQGMLVLGRAMGAREFDAAEHRRYPDRHRPAQRISFGASRHQCRAICAKPVGLAAMAWVGGQFSPFEIDPIEPGYAGKILICAYEGEAMVQGGGGQPGVVFAEALCQATLQQCSAACDG